MTHDPTVTSSSPPTDPPPSEPSPARSGGRLLLRRLHFYAGTLVAPFLLIAAVSGALYAVAPTMENIVYRGYLHTDSTGTPQPLANQVTAAVESQPDLELSAVRPSTQPGDTTRVLFDDPSLGESERLAVFVDPVTAEPVGDLVSYGSSGALPLRTWISQLHRHLHLGEPGRIYSELAASWLWVIALGGLALWIARYRKGRGKLRLATVDRTTRGRNRTLSWHGAIGVWIVVGLVFLSATGLTWSRFAGENVSELRTALQWTTPSVDTGLGANTDDSGADHSGHAGHGTADAAATGADALPAADQAGQLDRVLTVARDAGITDKVEITVPADVQTAYKVTETREAWQLSPNTVAVDAGTGAVVDESWFANWPMAAKLTNWGIALHMGLLFGLLNQLALLVLALALVVLIVRGYQMWWQRRPRNGSRRVGRAPVRGALQALPPATAVGVVLAAVAVGWFVPLLGISLAAFLLVDVVIGAVDRARAS